MLVFFDVDGVLNTKQDWQDKYIINPNCVINFADFIHTLQKYTSVSLVICSTWRLGISDTLQSSSKQIQNLKEIFKQHDLFIDGQTPYSNKGRQAEIEYYIRHSSDKNFIVIDDDPSLFENPNNITLYVPDFNKGFTRADIKQALKIARKALP